jgi:HD-GYP domain-containing protein (c-di-GMP phosphodiesterase class II)
MVADGNVGPGAPKLAVAVRSLEGAEILPAGASLDASTLAAVAEAGRRVRWERRSILAHGSVRRDLASGARAGHYARVFGSPEEYRDLETLMAATLVPEPCLRGLDWFRDSDPCTYRHILMVFALSCLLAQRSGRTGPRFAHETAAGPLHDFGKICVPVPVLAKRTALTHAERRLLEHHTVAGCVLLCHYVGDHEDFTARVARDHHERRDRSGYPRALALDDPLVEIVAVCDVYDALVSARPYRQGAFDNRAALEELTGMAEAGRIGWEVVQLLVSLNRRDRPAPEHTEVSRQRRGHPPAVNLYGLFADGAS